MNKTGFKQQRSNSNQKNQEASQAPNPSSQNMQIGGVGQPQTLNGQKGTPTVSNVVNAKGNNQNEEISPQRLGKLRGLSP